MSNIAILQKRKKQYDLFELITRSEEPEIKSIYRKAIKEANKEQQEIIRHAKRLK